MALDETGSPSMSRADVSARDSDSAITRIQAHARGNQVRKGRSCNMVDNLVQRLTPTGAASKVKETGEMAAQVAARTLSPAVKAASTISAELRTDLASRHVDIKRALENHLEFSFLASDTHPMHGLQDWSTAEWAAQIEQHPELSALLAQTLLGGEHDESTPPHDLALEIKKALREAQPLSRWRAVVAYQNACLNASHSRDDDHEAFYMSPGLLSNAMFHRDFPLGVDKRIAQYRWRFAVQNSGLAVIRHRESKGVERALLLCVIVVFGGIIAYFLNYATNNELWTFDSTIVETSLEDYSDKVVRRTQERGVVASILSTFAYAGTVNASLDKFGKIDPSTSTVLIGLLLGNTFGFMLDTMIASDEGLREYLWSPQMGMKYALGSLASDRFGRFIITIIFDTFFMVILFKHGYAFLVCTAGFSKNGREWIANFVVSSAIGVLLFVVFSNMTRFEWAYPSGIEDPDEPWIQGPTMLLVVVVMNMVYLQSETRVRIDEPGINDPYIKLLVTGLNFFILYLLNENDFLDPSEMPRAQNVTPDFRDVSLPLKGVCESQARFGMGVLIFTAITVICLAGVIFGTSTALLSEIKAELKCFGKAEEVVPQAATHEAQTQGQAASTSASTTPPSSPGARVRRLKPSLKRQPSSTPSIKRQTSRNTTPSLKRQKSFNTVTFASNDATQRAKVRKDLARGKLCLFFSYLLIIFVLMLIFAFVPFYSDDNGGIPRNESAWRTACDKNDIKVLDLYGLS